MKNKLLGGLSLGLVYGVPIGIAMNFGIAENNFDFKLSIPLMITSLFFLNKAAKSIDKSVKASENKQLESFWTSTKSITFTILFLGILNFVINNSVEMQVIALAYAGGVGASVPLNYFRLKEKTI